MSVEEMEKAVEWLLENSPESINSMNPVGSLRAGLKVGVYCPIRDAPIRTESPTDEQLLGLIKKYAKIKYCGIHYCARYTPPSYGCDELKALKPHLRTAIANRFCTTDRWSVCFRNR